MTCLVPPSGQRVGVATMSLRLPNLHAWLPAPRPRRIATLSHGSIPAPVEQSKPCCTGACHTAAGADGADHALGITGIAVAPPDRGDTPWVLLWRDARGWGLARRAPCTTSIGHEQRLAPHAATRGIVFWACPAHGVDRNEVVRPGC